MRRLYPVGLGLVLVGLYAALAIGSLSNSLGTVVFAALATYVVDALMLRSGSDRLLRGLDLVQAGLPWRVFIRQVLITLFLLRSGHMSRGALTVVIVCIVAHHLVVGLYDGLALVASRRRLRRVETRNLPVPGAHIPYPSARWLAGEDARIPLHSDIFLWAGLAVALVAGTYRFVAPTAVLMVAAAMAFPVARLPELIALLRLPGDDERRAAARQAVDAYRPQVILHFSGGVTSVYQVNMWLETMERLNQRVLILLRERRYFSDVADSSVPVLCLPFTADLMNFSFPGARIALYVSNVGKNIHLLRVPKLLSAFIGHGDSDKTASFNPYSKVYDEVWVVGAAGRDRYLRAQVGVRSEQIVLVGRPQLDGIRSVSDRPVQTPFTVLYAPTWEGWTDDPTATSVTSMGPDIVRTVMAAPGTRIIYKPHPLTGTVDPSARRASEAIVALLSGTGPEHEVVLGAERSLYDCFDESDALVSDISSVVSDYLASEKPYFVANTAAQDEDTFRAQNPSAAAAYLFGPGAEGLANGLAAARSDDPMRVRRHEVRVYLLGDSDVEAMTLFRRAVADLVARSQRRLDDLAGTPTADLPPAEPEPEPDAVMGQRQ